MNKEPNLRVFEQNSVNESKILAVLSSSNLNLTASNKILVKIELSETLHDFKRVYSAIFGLIRSHPRAFADPPILTDGRTKSLNKIFSTPRGEKITLKNNRGINYYLLNNTVYGLIIFLRIYDITKGCAAGYVPEFSYLEVPLFIREWYKKKSINESNKSFRIHENQIQELEVKYFGNQHKHAA